MGNCIGQSIEIGLIQAFRDVNNKPNTVNTNKPNTNKPNTVNTKTVNKKKKRKTRKHNKNDVELEPIRVKNVKMGTIIL